MNGHPLTIRSRIPTEIHAATISVAQIEFATSKNRQEVTKLDENEADAATEIRLCPALDKEPLKYRLLLMVVFMLRRLAFHCRQPQSQVSKTRPRFAYPHLNCRFDNPKDRGELP
jgi:hypothetical protein